MAFTILANSTTASATDVMGNFYYVGAGNNLPYFQTTAGNLSAVDNTYDLGADTTAWRRLYTKQIGDAAFGYVIEGTSVTVNADVTFNSAAALAVECTATMQEIYNVQGIKHSVGPKVYTAYISIGSWAFSGTDTVWVDISPYFTTHTVYPLNISAIVFADEDIRQSATPPTVGGVSLYTIDLMNEQMSSAGQAGVIGVTYYKFADVPTVPAIRLNRYMWNICSNSAAYNDLAINRGFVRLEYMRT